MNKAMKRLLLGLSLVTVVPFAAAAAFPEKQIKLVVPFPAGGPSDVAARTVAEGLSARLKQPVVVENQAGAGGTVAAQGVMRAQPDGYTLLWGVASMATIPLLQKNPPFRSLKDFTPVGMVGRFGFGLFINPSVPAKTVSQFTEYAKANPDKLSYAAAALSEYLVTTEYMKRTQTKMIRVPYKGAAQAMPDLLAGRTQVFFTPLGIGNQYVQTGQLRLLAVLQSDRSALNPDVPTIDEAGVPGIAVPTWQAVFAPPRTPQAIAEQLAHALQQVTEDKEIRARLAKQAMLPERAGSAHLSRQISLDEPMWEQFVREYEIPKE